MDFSPSPGDIRFLEEALRVSHDAAAYLLHVAGGNLGGALDIAHARATFPAGAPPSAPPAAAEPAPVLAPLSQLLSAADSYGRAADIAAAQRESVATAVEVGGGAPHGPRRLPL